VREEKPGSGCSPRGEGREKVSWKERRQARRQRKAERRRAEEIARALREATVQEVAAKRRLDELQELSVISRLEHSLPPWPGIVLKKGEQLYLSIDGVSFIEPRRQPGHWSGGSQGMSFRVAKGVRYRVGATRGTFVPGDEVITPTDHGHFIVTSQRCEFLGERRNTEWTFTKLLGFSLEHRGRCIFNVSNRQKPSGVLYGEGLDDRVECVLTAAIAHFQGAEEHAAVVAAIDEQCREAYSAWQQVEQSRARLALGAGP
jgi:hypothetical protein